MKREAPLLCLFWCSPEFPSGRAPPYSRLTFSLDSARRSAKPIKFISTWSVQSINLESIPEIGPKLVAPSHFFGGIKNEIFLLPRALHSGEKLVVRWPEEWDRASYLDKITLKYAQAANFSSSQRARQLFFLSGLYTCTCVQTATPPHTNSRAQLCWGAKALESFAKLVVGPSII